MKELITWYKPAVIWFDGDWTYNDGAPTLKKWWTKSDEEILYKFMTDLDSNLIINDRIIRGLGMGDFETAEGKVPKKPMFRQWETCRNMNGSWGYNSKKTKYKSPLELIREMVTVVSRDGNYLLNIGPKGDGTVTKQEVEILSKIGDWMRVNGESIYDATRSPFKTEPSWGFYTKRTNRLYAHVFNWPKNNMLQVPSSEEKITRICMLSNQNLNLNFTESSGKINIKLPENAADPINSVVMIDFSNPTAFHDNAIQIHRKAVILEHSYPHPFDGYTTVNYILQTSSRVGLYIFNQSGRGVETLVDENQTAGFHEITYRPKGLAPGIYFLKLKADYPAASNRSGISETRKLILP